uniref:Uncharacterized protein n=1 Tax=Anguilla anguilla TaxID=7936 RepID=A0A0E9VHL1_ANGAN
MKWCEQASEGWGGDERLPIFRLRTPPFHPYSPLQIPTSLPANTQKCPRGYLGLRDKTTSKC